MGCVKMRVRVSSRGRIVIPKRVRESLGIRKGSVLNLRVEGKKIILEMVSEPPEEIFVRVGSNVVEEILRGSKLSSDKAESLLGELGVID